MIFKPQLLLNVLIPLGVFLSGCSSSQRNNGKSGETSTLSDSILYIREANAETVLPDWSAINTFVMHCIAEPDLLHPTNGTSGIRTEINQYTQMFLVRVDFRTLELAPALLKQMPMMEADGLSYSCELRNDPRWDDGSPVTSEDVLFTAMANKCPLTDNPQAKPYWDNLEQVIPDSQNKLKFTVKMKTPYMHNIAFWGDFPIMQRAFFDTSNVMGHCTFEQFNDTAFNASKSSELLNWSQHFNSADYGREPAFLKGLGPYQVTGWDPGISVTLTKKENHWTKGSADIYETSYPDKIIFRVNKDPNSQLLDFKAQVLDGSTNISTKTLLDLQSDSLFNANYHSRFTDSFNYTYIAMNMRPDGVKHKPVFVDKRVRRAMALLTPVDDLNRVINKGKNKRMTSPVSILKKEYDPSLTAIPYDPKQAMELLTDAGWTDSDGDGILDHIEKGKKIPFEFDLTYMTNTPEWQEYATLLAESWSKAGMKVNLNPLDFSISSANARKHDFDVMIAVWGQSALPEDFTQLWHTESWINEGANYPGFGNTASDALIDSIKTITDSAKRLPLVIRFQKMVYDEQPMIFLFSSMRRNIIHKRFGNVEIYFERPGLLVNNFQLLSSTVNAQP